ncbi:hypothetical protein [Demequina sp.]|uniref:hypothetical protein n=1 Tax=Demequina sp. TaxID=2050685 RepID=UPI0025BB50F0|nr:hypothetical protein [Demequina sp.]
MRYMFEPSDTTLPWAGEALPIVPPLKMPMDALSEALTAKKWRMADLHALLRRISLDSYERQLERQGKEYTGPPSEITGADDVVANQLSVFATLRRAGYRVAWEQVCEMGVSEFHVISEDAADEALLSEYEDAAEGDDADPQPPSKGSAPASDGATEPTSESPGHQ